MARVRFCLLALVVLLALPPGLFLGWDDAPLPLAASPALTPRSAGEGEAALQARQRSQRLAKRRHARRAERKAQRRERQQALTPDQVRIAALAEVAPPRLPALAVTRDPCGPGLIQLPRSGRCTHGPDASPPPEVAALAPLSAAAVRRETAAIGCEEGSAGFRVQVLYLRAATSQDRYAPSLASIRAAAAGANAVMRESSSAAGQELSYHFVLDDSCAIDVLDVSLSSAAMTNFDWTIEELEQRGFDRVDRIYLLFADTSAAGICGIATAWMDDRDSPANPSNRGPSYARADLGCWDAHTAAHELMHTLGSVQRSAPHSTGYGHCWDEYDVMCYEDDPRAPSMQVLCPGADIFEIRYDCQNDDYFAPLPVAGSYLDTHWNTADNWFLTQDVPPDADLDPPAVTWQDPVGNGLTFAVPGSGSVPLRAQVTDESGVAYVEFWLFDAMSDDWTLLGEDATGPVYTSSVAVSALREGLNWITADAYDTQGNWTDEGIWLQRTAAPDPGGSATPTITLVASRSRVKAKQRVTLSAAVANVAVGPSSVEFRFCRGRGCSWDNGLPLAVLAGPSASTTWRASGKGRVTFLAQVSCATGSATSDPVTVVVKKPKKKR